MLTSTSQVLSNWKFWAQMVQQLVIAASVNYWLTHFTMHDGDLRFWEKNEHGVWLRLLATLLCAVRLVTTVVPWLLWRGAQGSTWWRSWCWKPCFCRCL